MNIEREEAMTNQDEQTNDNDIIVMLIALGIACAILGFIAVGMIVSY